MRIGTAYEDQRAQSLEYSSELEGYLALIEELEGRQAISHHANARKPERHYSGRFYRLSCCTSASVSMHLFNGKEHCISK